MRNLGLIIFLILGVLWPVIQKSIEAAEKRKRAEAARQARLQQGQGGVASSGGAPASARESRMADLAARRKAQLEELRRRRARGGVPAPPTATAPEPAPAPVRGRRSGEIQEMPPTRRPSAERSDARREAAIQRERERRAAELRRRQEQEVARQRVAVRERYDLEQARAEAEAQRARESRGAARRAADAAAHAALPDAYAQRRKADRRAVVQRALQGRQGLRELIVLKELLDEPLSLRR